MADYSHAPRVAWVRLDKAWVERQVVEAITIFFAPFVGAAQGFWNRVRRPRRTS